MIKKLLFIFAVAATGVLSAQTFQIQDHLDNNIEGTHHYEYGSNLYLSETKFHVKNISGSMATYSAKVYEIENPKGSDLQVCFGSNCFTSSQTITGTVNLPAGNTDTTFKAAPFTFAWGVGDSATWRVTIYNVSNPNDSSSAIITWRENSTSIENLNSTDVSYKVYPNPATDVLKINYAFNGKVINPVVEVFDVLGQQVATHQLVSQSGTLKLNVSNMKAGVYFYSIRSGNETLKTERVMIR
ncbi:MAG: T9SS type A sorting domain-containing protein [Flavobacteriales bacterium]|nr:T9SS type A sorting domain-containing protein [Flavobacteriales bacterium]